jgi:tetratricopeptide (TPR) repeat protein/signal transduction histidine kinase
MRAIHLLKAIKHVGLLHFAILACLLLCNLSTAHAQNRAIDSLTNLIKNHPQEDDRKGTLLFELSSQYFLTDPKKSTAYLDQLLAFKDKIKLKAIVASSYRAIGYTYYLRSMLPEAIASFTEALKLDRQYKFTAGIPADLSFLGSIYLGQSNFTQALSAYLEAGRMFEKMIGHEKDETIVYANIGVIYLQLNNYDKALEHFNKAYDIFIRLKDNTGAGNMLGNIATIASKQKNNEKAINYSNKALRFYEATNDKIGTARETGNMAGYYNLLNKYDLALQYGLKAIALNQVIDNKKSIGYNSQNVAEAYLKKGAYALSKNYGLAAFNIGNQLKIPEISRDAAEGLSRLYEKKGMPDSALFYYRQYTSLKDSTINDQKRQEITRMTIQYDFDKKETDYKQAQLLSNEKLKQQRLQLALNNQQLQTGKQQQALQKVQIQNEKLQTREKQKQLQISINNEKLQKNKVKALSQQQQLEKLQSRQLWLYTILFVVILLSVLIFLLNQYRIRQLRLKNTLQYQEAEQQAREITYQNKLSESELKAIRSQMNPHFIFNVLNSIESYVLENDSKTASRLVQKFATLSRLILENSTQSMVAAEREWKALKLYTELEAMRFNNQFSYHFYADPDLDLATLMLPPMLVQPLIENSIHHGLRNSLEEKSSVNVRLEQTDNEIFFTIDDTGIGMDEAEKFKTFSAVKSKSIGLNAIRERVEIINVMSKGNKAHFEIRKKTKDEGIGTIAILTLPKVIRNNYLP